MAKEKSPIIEAVKRVTPAVVSVVVSKDLPKIRQYFQPFDPWGLTIPQYRQEGTKRVKVGGGSGFVVSANGIILTNRHVVSEPQAQYTVILGEGKEYPAKVWARDPINDVAVIQIEASKLPTVKLGNSSRLELGQTVIAVGNALGEFQNTVSTGVISGLSRFITAASSLSGQTQQLRGLIQTDAAINPGNSGGPLVDINGKAIGINTAVVWGAQNIGFTIPINKAKKDLEDLKQFGRIVQPSLGVRYVQINKDLREENNLPIDYGALIIPEEIPGDKGVVPGSSADRAGLQEYDIIIEFNGIKIDEKNNLASLIEECKVDDEISLKILRRGKEVNLKAVLGERK